MQVSPEASRPAGAFDPVSRGVRRVLLILVLLLTLFNAGCVSTYFVRVAPETPVELMEDEALVVIQIDTDLPIRSITLSNLYLKTPIEVGQHFFLARMRPGSQTWLNVYIEGRGGFAGRYRLKKSALPSPNELKFSVDPGVINYAGKLIIRKAVATWFGRWVSIRIRNHAAMALRDLERSYGPLLDTYGIRSAGKSGDPFIEFYAAERERIRREALPEPENMDSAP